MCEREIMWETRRSEPLMGTFECVMCEIEYSDTERKAVIYRMDTPSDILCVECVTFCEECL